MGLHLWIRAECRAQERRVGLTPEGAAQLIASGMRVSVEDSPQRALPIEEYRAAGCQIVEAASWPEAPADAWIFGLKELPEDGTPLRHRHIMFGHAYKGQPGAQAFLARFRSGGGALYDLEYLTDAAGRRVAAFGYWAGYAGAAVSLMAIAAQSRGGLLRTVPPVAGAEALVAGLSEALAGSAPPRVIVIGALGRVGTGARDLCAALGLEVTAWDMDETAHGGPFPQIAEHEVFLNCILAGPGVPVFFGPQAADGPRVLRVIGDIACDPGSAYNPVPLYEAATSFAAPVVRVRQQPTLDIMAIDNLPSLLPAESSADFAAQLLPSLKVLDRPGEGVWARARALFDSHSTAPDGAR
ncbi:MAG: saccharopine dehydrogenase [Rhodobacteraceae bacterium]|nr:saccharopine dehydrogenase [Paracoccaceae bacterium]